MLKNLSISTCLGLATLLVQGSLADAQTAPVREGLQRTGQAVAEGTRAAVRGTQEAVQRAGQATRDAVGNTIDAARPGVDSAERSALRTDAGAAANVDANGNLNAGAQAGSSQIQADANLNTNPQFDANGQVEGQINNQTSNEQYQSGYRGVDDQGAPIAEDQLSVQSGSFQRGSQVEHNGQMYGVRHNSQGRPFICVRGCPVYLDEQAGAPQAHEAYKLDNDHMQHDSAQGQQQQDRTYMPQNGQGAPPVPPAPIRTEVDSAAPASPSLNSDAQINADQSRSLNDSANVGAGANADANIGASGASGTGSGSVNASGGVSTSGTGADASASGSVSGDAISE